MERREIFIAIGQALFAIFGSCVKWLNEKHKKKAKWSTFLTRIGTSAFMGMLVYFLHVGFGLNVFLGFALAGIFGWWGAKGIDKLWDIITAKIGIVSLDEPADDEEAAG